MGESYKDSPLFFKRWGKCPAQGWNLGPQQWTLSPDWWTTKEFPEEGSFKLTSSLVHSCCLNRIHCPLAGDKLTTSAGSAGSWQGEGILPTQTKNSSNMPQNDWTNLVSRRLWDHVGSITAIANTLCSIFFMQGTAIRTSGIKSLKIAYKLKKVWEKNKNHHPPLKTRHGKVKELPQYHKVGQWWRWSLNQWLSCFYTIRTKCAFLKKKKKEKIPKSMRKKLSLFVTHQERNTV